MLQALKATLTELAGSKKFLVFLATVIVAGAARLHWNVDQSQVLGLLGIASAYLVGQGVADHGSSTAQKAAEVAAAKELASRTDDAPAREAGLLALHRLACVPRGTKLAA